MDSAANNNFVLLSPGDDDDGGRGGGSTAVQVKAIVMNVVMKRLNKIHYDILFLKTFECLC